MCGLMLLFWLCELYVTVGCGASEGSQAMCELVLDIEDMMTYVQFDRIVQMCLKELCRSNVYWTVHHCNS